MRKTSADVSGISGNNAEFNPASFEYAHVSVVHQLVGAVRLLVRDIKTVGVFHYELARPHDSEPGANLIPEFSLYLVEINRKLLVGTDLPSCYVRYYFLMRGSQAEIPLGAVLEAKQFLSVVIPPCAFDPGLSGKHGGHEKLDCPGPVHFLPYYVLDFSYGSESQRKIVVDSGREFSYHAGSYHKLVTYNLGIRGVFLNRGYEIRRKPHPSFSFKAI